MSRPDPLTLIAFLRQTFNTMGPKKAVTFLRGGHRETELSYEELNRDSDALAHSFIERGVRKGDRVVIFLPKCVGWLVAHIAIQKIGAITVPLNPAFKKTEIEFFFQVTEPGLIVAGIEQKKIIKESNPEIVLHVIDSEKPYESPSGSAKESATPISEEPGLDDPALIVFTSGTTGRPKGAVLTQRNLSHDARNVVGIWEINSDDVFCHALPLFHVHGLCFGAHTALLAGATMIMLDSFDPNVVLRTLAHKETTMFMAVPTMYSKLLEEHAGITADYSHLRLLTSGSAPLLEKNFERIRDTFALEPVEREGMSETLMNFSNPLRGRRKPGSIGLPLPSVQVRIVNPETFEDVPQGSIGEIWLKSPAITPGYWNNPEETERAFVEGWFRTGDLGRRDKDGYYYLTDRIKNIIISGGENISPKEIELVINSHDAVLETCVIGIPDETWGEIVAAVVVTKPGASITPEKIQARCEERLLSWKCPKKVLIMNDLPKNRMGKVMRDKVKRLFH